MPKIKRDKVKNGKIKNRDKIVATKITKSNTTKRDPVISVHTNIKDDTNLSTHGFPPTITDTQELINQGGGDMIRDYPDAGLPHYFWS